VPVVAFTCDQMYVVIHAHVAVVFIIYACRHVCVIAYVPLSLCLCSRLRPLVCCLLKCGLSRICLYCLRVRLHQTQQTSSSSEKRKHIDRINKKLRQAHAEKLSSLALVGTGVIQPTVSELTRVLFNNMCMCHVHVSPQVHGL
jgi:hypothetical protein